MWKNLFYFTKRERVGILSLIFLLVCVFLFNHFFPKREKLPEGTNIPQNDNFVGKVNNNWREEPYKLKTFDPNGADSITFAELGLNSNVIKNIIKYRNKGGKFRTPDDIRKIYGISSEKAEELRSYVRIEAQGYEKKHKIQNQSSSIKTYYENSFSEKKDNNYPNKTEKYSSLVEININLADTSDLIKIPGIGESYAKRILKYRQILGGYYSLDQLKEVYGMYEELYGKIVPWFKIGDDQLRLIPVNNCSLDKLKAHPYINFYQAKAIIELRNKRGKLQEITQLKLLEEFTSSDIERLKYYLSFD